LRGYLLNMTYPKRNFSTIVWQSGTIVVLAIALALTVNHFRLDGRLPLIGDWSPKAQLSTLPTLEDAIVTLDEARALFLTHGAVFIDARPRELYLSGHIQGALNLPAADIEGTLSQVMQDVTPDSLIIAYCDGESCSLSKELAFELAARGYSHVRVLVNGWSIWQEANLPVEEGGGSDHS
jgi:rhodanese-related sulfurtransferase